jgi:hypothetical protein
MFYIVIRYRELEMRADNCRLHPRQPLAPVD